MSARVGAFAVTLPVAAHMPGGGDASMALILAVRRRPATLVVDALVDVRARFAGVDGVAFEGSGGEAFVESGNGKGTGVCVFCSGYTIIAGGQLDNC